MYERRRSSDPLQERRRRLQLGPPDLAASECSRRRRARDLGDFRWTPSSRTSTKSLDAGVKELVSAGGKRQRSAEGRAPLQ